MMTQIKIFKGLETNLSRLEEEVNEWIANSKVKVVNIVGNMAPQTVDTVQQKSSGLSASPPSDVLIIVVYDRS